tara:strand:+ start:356 stop:994 length:639 start_codon:yes stop_codon:yes gene_type:complete
MQVSTSAFYAWLKRPAEIVSVDELHLYRRMKQLFKKSRESLGSREMMKKLREEGFQIGRYRVRSLMNKLGLVVTQRIAYKVTTVRKHSDAVADNLLNQCFNPVAPNEVWAGDVTYLKTGEGWMYLATVMDLYSRRIVGWHVDKRMTKELVCKALIKAYNVRQPKDWYSTATVVLSTPVKAIVNCWLVMECEPAWVMLELVGIMLWLNVSLAV